MDAAKTPFEAGWWSFELPRYRECDGTYCYFAYDSLPPLDMSMFRGEFQWLKPSKETPKRTMLNGRLQKLLSEASLTQLKLPKAFVTFMGAPHLQEQIDSCTACYFTLPKSLYHSPLGDGGTLIRFLNDQQSVVLWYLYLAPDGDHCVVASLVDPQIEPLSPEDIKRVFVYCAPSFEAFIYRFWIENAVWFALDEGRELTEAEQAYLRHYRERK